MPDQSITLTTTTEIIPYLFCADAGASMDWLARVFGLTEEMRQPTPRGIHGEMSLGGCHIMLGSASDVQDLRTPAALGGATQGVFVYVPDVMAHYAHTLAEGGATQGEPTDHGYGLTYSVHDLDGHPWYFTQRP
jgi:uncharacterized glyoxalase superfamily protein PhnB